MYARHAVNSWPLRGLSSPAVAKVRRMIYRAAGYVSLHVLVQELEERGMRVAGLV